MSVPDDDRRPADTAVLVTRTVWTEIPRLRHQIARALAGHYRVLFVETPTDWRGTGPTVVEPVEPHVVRCRLSSRGNVPRPARLHLPGVNAMVQRFYMKEIRDCLDRAGGGGDVVLLNFNHDATRIMASPVFSARLYICNDDWPAKAPGALARLAVGRQEARVARTADCCLAVSYPLVARLERFNPRTRLFLPGHDFPAAPPERHERRDGRIRATFMGNVNRRVDGEWLSFAARQPDLEVHSIGTVELPDQEAAALRDAGVRFHEPRYGDALRRLLQAADVLVIPYRLLDDVLAVTASNKLFSYIAAGKPVVISDMPHFIDFGPGIIYRASSASDFVARIRAASAEDSDELRVRRGAIAREYGWDQRGQELRRILAELVAERTGDGAATA